MERTTIETGVASTIRSIARQVAAGAGLALLRGDVGIGKTFALDQVASEMEAEGVAVVRVTISKVICGSTSAFTRAVLAPYHIAAGSTQDAADAIWELLRAYPFQRGGTRALFIMDEAQEAKSVVLETMRFIWDLGDAARAGDRHAPAFGCLFVGNKTFMGKGGNVRAAAFRPLLSRVTHNVNLPGPSRVELTALARSLAPEDGEALSEPLELQAILRDLGEVVGNFRPLATAMLTSRTRAGDSPITPELLRAVIKSMGLR